MEQIQESISVKFKKSFSELEHFSGAEQRQKIDEMCEFLGKMDKRELLAVYDKEIINEIERMVDEKKLSLENAILLLKHIGYYKSLKNIWIEGLKYSSFRNKIEKIIIAEGKKQGKQNEKFLIDLIESHQALRYYCYVMSDELLSICMTCVLKAASKKEDDEETKKEVEIALVSLSSIDYWKQLENTRHLGNIAEIIIYHQQNHNLTSLAYQSIWEFLIGKTFHLKNLENLIDDKLKFIQQAAVELKDLKICVDWNIKEDEENEIKEVCVIKRWFNTIETYFKSIRKWRKEYSDFVMSIVCVCRAARENQRKKFKHSITLFLMMANFGAENMDDLLQSGAICLIFEEIIRPTLKNDYAKYCLRFFGLFSKKMRNKTGVLTDDLKAKMKKREIFEKLEEGGYEDAIIKFHKSEYVNRYSFDFISPSYYFLNE